VIPAQKPLAASASDEVPVEIEDPAKTEAVLAPEPVAEKPASKPEPVVAKPALKVEPVVAKPAPVVVKPPPEPVAAPEPAPPPKPKAVVAPVSAMINTLPAGSIFIDGVAKGPTWFQGTLEPGTHTLKMKANDGRSATTTITVRPNRDFRFCWSFDVGGPCPR
jgi:outer membrane biosynthesis protein TonB